MIYYTIFSKTNHWSSRVKKIDDGYPLGTPCLCSEYSGDEVECPIHGGEEE